MLETRALQHTVASHSGESHRLTWIRLIEEVDEAIDDSIDV
jgi:hypothetical protein